jgi:hypothetical protein
MTAWTRTETNRAGKVGDKPTVDSVHFSWVYDEHGDPSYYLDSEPDYEFLAKDKARFDAFNNGDWHMEGCRAVATVSYPIDSHGNRRLQEFSSGGLWGIESDSDTVYRKEVEREELADLKEHLAAFGIDTAELEAIAT